MFAAGKLPEDNNVAWREDSGLNDGIDNPSFKGNNLVGGYYDSSDAIKFSFPKSFAMTILSWSVIEYNAKYEAVGKLNRVKDIIKWGTDYFLKTFDSSADTIDRILMQVNVLHFSGCFTQIDTYEFITQQIFTLTQILVVHI